MTLPAALRASAITILSTAGLAFAATSANAGPVVLELFTSQGCSSCPPADLLLEELAGREDVIALSLNVHYWDYVGWTDTLARPEHAQRQWGYATARGQMQVYTPQIVVSGRWGVVGSDRGAVEAAMEAAQDLPGVDLSVEWSNAGLQLNVGEGPDRGTLWMVLFDDSETVAIGSGENANRTITYHNVVLDMHRLAMWRGNAMSIELPLMELREAGADGCVIILQQDVEGVDANGVTRMLPGPIIGAASYRLPN